MDGFNDFWNEESQTISEDSLKLLTPTMRSEGGRMIFTANPGSSEDPFSKRFIVPFQKELDSKGIYEDDLHLVIQINWRDNPWFPPELEQERQFDLANLPRALSDHIWEGAFNDSIENSLVMAEWFDACVDAHKKLGFQPMGAKIAAHDPSDKGPDSKGFAMRHGSVVTMIEEKTTGDVNEGCDWGTGLAIKAGANSFTWDCDGLGVSLARQIDSSFAGLGATVSMFKGSESPDNPDTIYEPCANSGIRNQSMVKDVVVNKRAQYYLALRDRIYRTYLAVEKGQYHNPDDLISFDSSCTGISQLRSELCRMPVKDNGSGRFELYTKAVMKSKFKLASPNLADSVMMTMRFTKPNQTYIKRPPPIKPMGRR
jgi:phage terminase large subunit